MRSLLDAIEASDMSEAAYSDADQIINVAAWSTGEYYVAFAHFGRSHNVQIYASVDHMLASESAVHDLADQQVWTAVRCEAVYAWD